MRRNFAYVFGQGKGENRKRTTYCSGDEPAFLDHYEVYVDGESRTISEEEYIELLKSRGAERLVQPQMASESEIAVQNTQYTYNTDYTVGDYVTVQHKRFGLLQPKFFPTHVGDSAITLLKLPSDIVSTSGENKCTVVTLSLGSISERSAGSNKSQSIEIKTAEYS